MRINMSFSFHSRHTTWQMSRLNGVEVRGELQRQNTRQDLRLTPYPHWGNLVGNQDSHNWAICYFPSKTTVERPPRALSLQQLTRLTKLWAGWPMCWSTLYTVSNMEGYWKLKYLIRNKYWLNKKILVPKKYFVMLLTTFKVFRDSSVKLLK